MTLTTITRTAIIVTTTTTTTMINADDNNHANHTDAAAADNINTDNNISDGDAADTNESMTPTTKSPPHVG